MKAKNPWRIGIICTLASLALASNIDSARVESISSRMYCNCGCGEMLSECAHAQCKRKTALKQEIADGILKNITDKEILKQMGSKYGATILAAPSFGGFNTLLWTAPAGIALLGVGIVLRSWRKSAGSRTPLP